MRQIKKKPLLFFIVAVVALYVVIYVLPQVVGALRMTYTVEYGQLQIFDEVDGYIVKNEKVYVSESGGEENQLIKEGTLVRKGTKIMELSGENDADPEREFRKIREAIGTNAVKSKKFKAKSEGIVSYYADGYEAELTPETMESKDYGYYHDLRNDRSVDLTRTKVSKGDPVFKIVDRSGWYLVCYIPAKHADRYVDDQRLKIVLEDGTRIIGRIDSIEQKRDRGRLIILTDYLYEPFATQRVVSMQVITSDAMGLLVENSSIVEKDGNQGVYVKTKTGDYEFVRIQVLTTDGKESVVTKSVFYDEKGKAVDTIRTYDEILRKP